MEKKFRYIDLRVPPSRFADWNQFLATTPEYSIGLEVIDDTPGRRGNHVHFDHHSGVVREATMSAAMQAYLAVRQGRLMQRWLPHRCPLPVYVWNADQDVCLASFILEYHELLERFHADPLLRWIVQFNNKVDVCGGLYPVDLAELVRNHFTWVFEPFREQRMKGKTEGDEALVTGTIRLVCDRLEDFLHGRAGTAPIVTEPEILFTSTHGYAIADEKGDPNSRLVLAAQGHTNLISLVCRRDNGRYTYSVIRGSPYDDETFQVGRLIEAFQAAEDLPDVRIWGGSNLAAGSDSEVGSSLHWTRIRDIAEAVVEQASRRRVTQTSGERRSATRILLVMPASEAGVLLELLRQCGAEGIVASTCREAGAGLDPGIPIQAIFSTRCLPDGDFRDLARMGRECPYPVPLVLCLPQIDGGWSDLLEAGALDLLVQPYRSERIQRVIEELAYYRRTASAASA